MSLLLGGRNGDGLEKSASLSISISTHTEGPAPPQGIPPVPDVYIGREEIQKDIEKLTDDKDKVKGETTKM